MALLRGWIFGVPYKLCRAVKTYKPMAMMPQANQYRIMKPEFLLDLSIFID